MTEQDKIKHLRRCAGNLLKGLNQPGATLDSPEVRRGLIGLAKLIEQGGLLPPADQPTAETALPPDLLLNLR